MNNYKQCETLISDILDLKLGVGDIVKHDGCETEIVCSIWSYEGKDKRVGIFWQGDSVFDVLESEVKLKQRSITLPMVLEAIKKKEVNWNIIPSDANNIDFVKIIPDGWEYLADWQLRKDGKDCSLFDQKNETVKFIIKVLK